MTESSLSHSLVRPCPNPRVRTVRPLPVFRPPSPTPVAAPLSVSGRWHPSSLTVSGQPHQASSPVVRPHRICEQVLRPPALPRVRTPCPALLSGLRGCLDRDSDTMASLLSKTQLFSSLRGKSQMQQGQQFMLPRREFHIELGTREKALLEEDPALKKFKSHKKAVGQIKRIGDALIIAVVAACSYEIYVNAVEKAAKFEAAHQSSHTNV